MVNMKTLCFKLLWMLRIKYQQIQKEKVETSIIDNGFLFCFQYDVLSTQLYTGGLRHRLIHTSEKKMVFTVVSLCRATET